ncbi:MAG: carbon-nitrogen hydrolase [Acidobacteria bacterium]|nr:carbon-nitrogen hydrolase [Acidobacteriota bacterium]
MAARRQPGAPPRPRLRVALAQIAPMLGDFRRNLELHLRVAQAAAGRGAQLVIFPELSLTGYRLQDLVAEVAVRIDDPTVLEPLLKLSRRIALVIGLVEESEGHRYYNSALFLEGGRIRHVHRKAYLPTYGMFEEGRYFSSGDALQAFRARTGRFGMLVCEDLWHPATALVMAQDGADYLLVLSNGPTHGLESAGEPASRRTWRDLLKVTAQMQTVFMICVNRVGFEDGVNFGGSSSVHDPFGRLIAEAGFLEEETLVCDLERTTLRQARIAFPLLRDERLPLLSREVQRLLALPAGRRGPGGT